MNTQDKLTRLRQQMQAAHMDAWIAPATDPHQSEYVAAHWQTRAWLSGFNGSAGTLVVTHDKAGLWTDSRYYLQAETQLQDSGITLFRQGQPDVPTYPDWLANILPEGAALGFDGYLLSVSQVEKLREALQFKHIRLLLERDLAGEIWMDRPPLPGNAVSLMAESFAGESRREKCCRVREMLRAAGEDAQLLTALDDIAWLLNLRGGDVDYTPVVICYALIARDMLTLCIDEQKLSAEVRESLAADGVQFQPYQAITDVLRSLPVSTRLRLDPDTVSQFLLDVIPAHCSVVRAESIPMHLKSIKNAVELTGIRQAHVRDGIAMVRWLCWLSRVLQAASQTEISIAEKLHSLRSEGEHFHSLSFETIAGYREHGAIVHYAATQESAATLEAAGLLLVDSGAQYADGTTDITRTISLGQPTTEEKKHFTLVLKGHIQLARVRFPKGTNGAQLDSLARMHLWQHGLNYGHGTGHGVGHFLNVHEGPQRISPTSLVGLEPGMILSNEPGFYRQGCYGIRIESLVAVRADGQGEDGTPFYCFETLSLCPIDRTLVDTGLLGAEEICWLNTYHQQVFDTLSPHLPEAEVAWLRQATSPLAM